MAAEIGRQAVIPVAPDAIWRVVADPYALPRWWPFVERVEDVTDDGWTTVLRFGRGDPVRAPMRLDTDEPPKLRRWRQEPGGTPFERVFRSLLTEVRLIPSDEGDRVLVQLTVWQQPRGFGHVARGSLRRATRRQLDAALIGLGRAVGVG